MADPRNELMIRDDNAPISSSRNPSFRVPADAEYEADD